MEGIIRAVCLSEKKGVVKRPVEEGKLIENHGLQGDAHAGTWHRQVSLLSYDKIEQFNLSAGGDFQVSDGDFGENLVAEGIDFSALPVGTRFIIHSGGSAISGAAVPADGCADSPAGDDGADDKGGYSSEKNAGNTAAGEAEGGPVLELTQIGKQCHSDCAIRQRMGDCIMPREGVFARVIRGGKVRKGDRMSVQMPDTDRPFTAAVVVLSDKGAAGEREDKSGPAAAAMLKEAGYTVVDTIVLPDEEGLIQNCLKELADRRQVDLVVTSGGTGFSLRDRTPEATMAVADRVAPGIAEAIRMKSMAITDRAMLGRGVSVIRKGTLIVNLPGSPKAVEESLGFILGALDHGLRILRGSAGECARS